MNAESLKNYAIGTLTIILLVSLGFNVLPDDTHFCRDLGISKSCNRLSSTENTCYPYPETRVGSKFCSTGWEEIVKTFEESTEEFKPMKVKCNGEEWLVDNTEYLTPYTKLKNAEKEGYLGECI